jgi:hypothetical protein
MATEQSTSRGEVSCENRAAMIDQLLSSQPLPMIQASIEALRRDLPDLLKEHRGKWVAYHGDDRIGVARTQTELCGECFRRGLTRDQIIVCGIDEGLFDPEEEIQTGVDV